MHFHNSVIMRRMARCGVTHLSSSTWEADTALGNIVSSALAEAAQLGLSQTRQKETKTENEAKEKISK